MAKVTIAVGLLLAAVGLAGYMMFGAKLHPLWFGLVLIACGALAMTENAKRRMFWMHIAVTVGLIGFLIPGVRAVAWIMRPDPAIPHGLVGERFLVVLICAVYVLLCVRSFIAARRARTVAP